MRKIILIVMLLALPLVCFAETIVLKSGKTIEAKIVEKTDKYVRIDFEGVPLTYFLEDIESIDGNKIVISSSLDKAPIVTDITASSEPTKYASTQSIGKTYVQKDGLFSISVPNAWHWKEKAGDIGITNAEEKNGIAIIFNPYAEVSEEQAKEILKKGNEVMVEIGIKPKKGIVFDEKETRIDGVYARQLDFSPFPEKPWHMTYISFLNKGYAFTITFGSDVEEERLIMEKIVKTFKFQ